MSLSRVFNIYQKVLNRHPFVMQGVQTGLLMGTGDLISQTVIERKHLKQVDFRRTLKFASIGLCFCGPALRTWYGTLHYFFGSGGKTTAIKKVFCDQVLFAPIFLFTLLVAVGITQGKSWDNIEKDVKNNYPDVLKSNYTLWPAVQLFNFYYVPLQYQVLLAQIVAVFWNTYISWKTNKSKISLVK